MSDEIVWYCLLEHRRAAAEQSTMKLEKAIKSYEDTLKRFPKNADGHALYAQVRDMQEDRHNYIHFSINFKVQPHIMQKKC